MSCKSRSTDGWHALNILDTRSIMGEIHNLLMCSGLVAAVEVVKLKTPAEAPTKESLKSRPDLAVFDNIV